MLNLVLLSALLVVIMGAVLGFTIGIAAKVFAVKQDPRIEDVEESLPGANCGGCGLAGCADFAKALVAGKVEAGDCPVCSSGDIEKIAGILGLSASESLKSVAVVLCGGDMEKSKLAAEYNGINDCKSAVLVGSGVKGCRYGCLGLGTCARACPFNAIEITEKGLAVVHPDQCVGCGKCVRECPRDLVRMVPETAKVHIYCNSPEKAAGKRKVCSAACIGCRKCLKTADEGQIKMNGFLAQINYQSPPPPEIVEATGCPTKCLESIDINDNRISRSN